MVVGLVKT